MENYIYFNNEYFLTKDHFTDKLREKLKLNGGKNLPEADNDELYDLYRQDVFSRFGLQKKDDIDKNGALADISQFFKLGEVIGLNIHKYLRINDINIPLCNSNKLSIDNGTLRNSEISKTNGSFTVNSLKLPSILLENADSQNHSFYFEYNIHRTANQRITPTLFFKDDTGTRKYETSSVVDLSTKHDDAIEFVIPLKDMLENGAGTYTLSYNNVELCNVRVPKVKLPLVEIRDDNGTSTYLSIKDNKSLLNEAGGIENLEQLKSFLTTLSAEEPTTNLLNLYLLIRYRYLEYWINDAEIKGKLQKILDDWENEGHTMTFNDLNIIFKRFKIQNKLLFNVSKYLTFEIKQIKSKGIIHIGAESNHYLKWGTKDYGTIGIIIQPKKEVIDWNLNYDFKFRVGENNLKGKNLSFNVSELGENGKYFKYEYDSSDFSDLHMGTYSLSLISKRETIKTGFSFTITGEVITLNLSKDVSMPMVGIRSDQVNFYISQTPITQQQLRTIAKLDPTGLLKFSLRKSVTAHSENNYYPATHIEVSDCDCINKCLNEQFKDYKFMNPTCRELDFALTNGFGGLSNAPQKNAYEKIQEVKRKHVTALNVYDLLENVYLNTSDSKVPWRGEAKVAIFGVSYYDEINLQNLQPTIIHYYSKSELRTDRILCALGYCPIMVPNATSQEGATV